MEATGLEVEVCTSMTDLETSTETQPSFAFTAPINRFSPFSVFSACHAFYLRFCLLSSARNALEEMMFLESFRQQYVYRKRTTEPCFSMRPYTNESLNFK
jgi:hypothetical protein